MVELFLTPRWKAIRWFLLTNINLGQLESEYVADVSTFDIKINTDSTKVVDVGHF